MFLSCSSRALSLVKNLSRPGGNITGFVSLEKDISSKVFGILKEMVPQLSRIAVLANRSASSS